MTERDPLSASALAAVPEARDVALGILTDADGCRTDGEVPDAYPPCDECLRLADAVCRAVTPAVRDAVLSAERDRLLAMTPEEVVEAARGYAVNQLAMGLFESETWTKDWSNPEPQADRHRDARRLVGRFWDFIVKYLFAPEVAKREQAERERDELRGGPEGPFPACHDCGRRMVWGYGNSPSWVCPAHVWLRMTAAEAERDRLREALGKYGRHFAYCPKFAFGGNQCSCGFDAALGGSDV